MKKNWPIIIFMVSACCLANRALCSSPAAPAPEPLRLAATIFPLADMVRQVAGPDARVIQILPAGASPHTFDLTPGKIRELQKARLIFKIGIIDDWIDGIAESVPGAEIVSLQSRVVLKSFPADGHEHERRDASHPLFDPHYWLDLKNGAIMTQSICARLVALDPGRAALYRENSRRYQNELLRLDAELKRTCAALKNRKLIVFHDGWRYFASAYGLEIVAVFQPAPGREPTPRDLQKLYALARTDKIKVVFSEPQLPTTTLEPLLEDLDLRLLSLDPLGGAIAGDSYTGLMRRNVESLLSADRL
ncbi:MAG: metal ABC transporter substrate-binding protein [Candidatus Aminicenantes bacterium]|nr:metal ABC transporter substrate-binding protein [Candidatus Aminicenantes bacterium]